MKTIFFLFSVFLSFCCCCCWKPERLEIFFLYCSTHGISQLNCTFPLYFIWVIKALWRLKIISPQSYAKQTGTFHTKSSEFERNRWKLWKWTHFGKKHFQIEIMRSQIIATRSLIIEMVWCCRQVSRHHHRLISI